MRVRWSNIADSIRLAGEQRLSKLQETWSGVYNSPGDISLNTLKQSFKPNPTPNAVDTESAVAAWFDEHAAAAFERYDLEGSGRVEGAASLEQLTLTVYTKLGGAIQLPFMVRNEDIAVAIAAVQMDGEISMTLEEFWQWFLNLIRVQSFCINPTRSVVSDPPSTSGSSSSRSSHDETAPLTPSHKRLEQAE